MSEHNKDFAICVENADYEASLILRKVREISGGTVRNANSAINRTPNHAGLISRHLPHFIGGMVFAA